jgi:hypothetical protein
LPIGAVTGDTFSLTPPFEPTELTVSGTRRWRVPGQRAEVVTAGGTATAHGNSGRLATRCLEVAGRPDGGLVPGTMPRVPERAPGVPPDGFPAGTALTWPDGSPAGHLRRPAGVPGLAPDPAGGRACLDAMKVPGGTLHLCVEGARIADATPAPAPVYAVAASAATIKSRVIPQYPAAARALNLGNADCRVRVAVDATGAPVRVAPVACPTVFEKATIDAVMKWRWYPQKVDGVAVPFETNLRIDYRLP